jgi:hypothetical protein
MQSEFPTKAFKQDVECVYDITGILSLLSWQTLSLKPGKFKQGGHVRVSKPMPVKNV